VRWTWKITSWGRWQKILLALLILFALYNLVGFLILPPTLRNVLENRLSRSLHRTVTVDGLSINPYALSCVVTGLRVEQRSGTEPLATFDKLYLNLQAVSLIKRAWVIKELRVVGPHIEVVRLDENRYNFSDLVQRTSGAPAEEPRRRPRFAVHNIQVSGGLIRIKDVPHDTTHLIEDLRLDIPFISNMDVDIDTWVEPLFEAKVDGSSVRITGRSKPFTPNRHTIVDVDVSGIDLPRYLAYLPMKLNLQVGSGILDSEITLDFKMGEAPALKANGRLTLHDAVAVQPDGRDLLRIPELTARQIDFDLQGKALTVGELSTARGTLSLVRRADGKLNLQGLFPRRKEEGNDAGGSAQGHKRWEIALTKAEVQDYTVDLADNGVKRPAEESDGGTSGPFRMKLRNLDLSAKALRIAPEFEAQVKLSASTEADEQIELQGRLALEPLASEGRVALSGLVVDKYAPYYQDRLPFDISGAKVAVSADYVYTRTGEAPQLKLSKAAVSLESLQLKEKGAQEPFLSVPALSLRETAFDLQAKTLAIGGVNAENGRILVSREEGGRFKLPGVTARKSRMSPRETEQSEAKQTTPWRVTVEDGTLKHYSIAFEDRRVTEPVKLEVELVDLSVARISTAAVEPGHMSLSLRSSDGGSLSAGGDIGLKPLSLDLQVDARGIDVVPFQSYFPEYVGVRITHAAFSADGRLQVSPGADHGLTAGYIGSASVDDFASHVPDEEGDFLTWKTFHVKGMDVGIKPTHFKAEHVDLKEFYSRVRISPQGSLNVMEAVTGTKTVSKKGEAPQAPPEGETKGPADSDGGQSGQNAGDPEVEKAREGDRAHIEISEVSLAGGEIDFSDNHIKPSFSAELKQVAGTIKDLSSRPDAKADVSLTGRLAENSPLEITGAVGPLGKELYVDLKIRFNDIDLTRVNPYAEKYVGYAIEKGSLYLDLKYLVVKKKLDSQNKLLFDQLTLGEKVESPDAIALPVKFAVSLLKNREGKISLDIPVKGDLGSPKFDLGKVIMKAIRGFLAKIVSAPFSFLGSLFGGGEDLRYVEFAYGSAQIDREAAAKLDNLAQALYQRPELKLDVAGYVDIDRDRAALKEDLLTGKLEAQKRTPSKEGQKNAEVKIGEAEYDRYLQMAFAQAFCQNKGGSEAAKLTEKQMEDLLLARARNLGQYGKNEGAEGLGQDVLLYELKKQKQKEMEQQGRKVPMNEITIAPGERSKYMRMVFAETFCAAGPATKVAGLPVEQMKKLLMETVEVSEKDIQELARSRAENVKDYLLNAVQLDPGRIFIVQPSALEPEPMKEFKKSRVDMKLH
jgi:uncharacterized protein involved in outer membrane biogenesis